MESDCLLKFCSLGSSLDYQSCLETFLGADSNIFSASLTLVGHIFLETGSYGGDLLYLLPERYDPPT